MTAPTDPRSGLAAQLRDEFDRAFALPVNPPRAQSSHLLAIRAGGDPYALSVAEITGLQADRTIVPVPAVIPELLGMAGIRGDLVPVYGLAALLGYDRERASRTPRWLALCGSDPILGLAFDEFERHLTLFLPQIAAADSANFRSEHVHAVAHADDGPRPVISIPSVVADIARRCATITVSKEK
jgi:purine-binding chemotaxis protein CheW